jgi:hypothetical protein
MEAVLRGLGEQPNCKFRVKELALRYLDSGGAVADLQVLYLPEACCYSRSVYFYEVDPREVEAELIRPRKGGVLERVDRIKGPKKVCLLLQLPWLAMNSEEAGLWARLLETYRY